jgi:hypothetical protein
MVGTIVIRKLESTKIFYTHRSVVPIEVSTKHRNEAFLVLAKYQLLEHFILNDRVLSLCVLSEHLAVVEFVGDTHGSA